MALADILEQIAADAAAEAHEVVALAAAEAAAIRAEAKRRAAERAARILAQAEADARREADAVRASARLCARDATLAAKQALIEEALERVASGLASLDSSRYARFVARRIVRAARGGEEVLIAAADRERLAGLPDAVEAAAREAGREGLVLHFSDQSAPVAYGVVLRGERDSVDLSVEGLIEAERDRLVARFAAVLFETDKGDGS